MSAGAPRRVDWSEGERRGRRPPKTSPRRREAAGKSAPNASVTKAKRERRRAPAGGLERGRAAGPQAPQDQPETEGSRREERAQRERDKSEA